MVRDNIDLEDDLSPSPSRLVDSLRDTGYSYQAAFADLIDNSVAAGASNVHVELNENFLGTDIVVNFFDDGEGMNEPSLVNAMRYGSAKRVSPKSLGKFGMGLKTASTAFCRKLTVISLKDESLSGRCWDIDKIKEENRWVLIKPDLSDYAEQIDRLNEIAINGSGTVVIWEKVDRLIAASGTDYKQQALERVVEEIRDHLSATFGKFLLGRNDSERIGSELSLIHI